MSGHTTQAIVGQVWDAVIVGGGMVGASVALGLGQQGMKVLLLERNEINTKWNPEQPYQVRVSALTRASENILHNLGAWKGIQTRRCHPFLSMHVWDSLSSGELHFSSKEMGEPNLGHVVENEVIQMALWEQVYCCDAIERLSQSTILGVRLEDNRAWLEVDGIGEVQTELLIGADGALSQIRALAHIGLETRDYEQCAVVGCVQTEQPTQDTCWQRYTQDGPFAYLSMGEYISSIAWYLPIEKMSWALSLSDEAFAQEVSRASGFCLGHVIKVGERAAFSLTRRHANQYVKPNLALVGDAAHTIHPQAGQGVNLGLLDAAALIETVLSAKHAGKPWGAYSVLRKYERWRRGDNAVVQRSMEAFDWLFKQDLAVKTPLRKGILPLANRLTPVKNWLMGQALNGREALPKLAECKDYFSMH